MMFSSLQTLFSVSLLSSIILIVSAPSWFLAWMGLELNLLSFIPLISSKNNQIASETSLKYFLIQALGSSMILLSASFLPLQANFALLILLLALMLKLGAAPFHFWFPQIMEGLSWPTALMLMTIQKISPMILISYLTKYDQTNYMLIQLAMLSSIIGGMSGINQTLLRKILAFSSINHMGWMLIALTMSETCWLYYFTLYCLTSISVALLFNQQKLSHISQLLNFKSQQASINLLNFLTLLSLGGLPPFIGFLPKWITIQELCSNNMLLPLMILLMSTLLTLYFYLRLTFSFYTLAAPKTFHTLNFNYQNSLTTFAIFINLMGLPLSLLVT
uniref:NADH-ubiquinone oxidoreductase chain 2 n=1 Tax=Thalassina kelanang TaxID=1114971 RepID=K4EXW8_THAKE|nr:NADH dehydrogenase subunit 2 [Thalassina kelanang]AEW68310.1 NADH dehydrogenase subunit 2 [Thalassina kelanang]